MYSTLEKTIMLKSVTLFQSIDAKELFHIAGIAQEQQLEADELLFSEGETGECLYVVVEGQVCIHRGEQEIACFGKGESLGEMALFDGLPRSASATATEATTVLKIAQEEFYNVMSSRVEIMQAVVKTLSLRLRDATNKVTALSAAH